jgi:hypothetical protein
VDVCRLVIVSVNREAQPVLEMDRRHCVTYPLG